MSQTLQQKNTRFLFYRLLLVLLGSSLLFYVLMRMQAHHMQEKQLELNQLHIRTAFSNNPALPREIPGQYHITEGDAMPAGRLGSIRDTMLYYPATGKSLPFQIVTEAFPVQGKTYQLTTYVSSTEISHLIIKVFLTEAGIFILLFVVIIYINRKTSGVLWRPFRQTMQQLRNYDITQHRQLPLEPQTGITEFDELNAELVSLIERDSSAYRSQQQFVENASHEMQTPLAIIRSKLELLINQQELTEETASLLSDITEANDRLSQMNKSLLLLAKIDNNQFPERCPVDIGAMVQAILTGYRQHFHEYFPEVRIENQTKATINANPALMEIMVGNLIKNAIVHNIPAGFIEIYIHPHELVFRNPGPALEGDPGQYFERFRKGSGDQQSTGLGLALVRQICRLYGFTPTYNFHQGIHTLTIRFN